MAYGDREELKGRVEWEGVHRWTVVCTEVWIYLPRGRKPILGWYWLAGGIGKP